MQVGTELKKLSLRAAYDYLDKDPEGNMPKLMDWVDRFMKDDILVIQRETFRKIITSRSGNWYDLMVSLWSDIDDDVRKALFENIVINANALAAPQARAAKDKYGCNIPWAIVFQMLSFDEVDDVIEQAKALGTFMFIFAGGEPLENKEEIIALCNKHEDCQFMGLTSGYDIDEDFADQLLRVKNFIPALCLTGSAEDCRVDDVMKILKDKKLPYGTYCIYDEANQEDVAREGFFDQIIAWGAKFCWFFSSLSEKDDRVYKLTREYRETKPLLTINFCKDKEIIGGCIAGGKYYCCINRNGDVEPCAFVHMSDSNIGSKTLLEAYQSPLFMKYHDGAVECKGIKTTK